MLCKIAGILLLKEMFKKSDESIVERGSNELIPLNAQGWDAFLNK